MFIIRSRNKRLVLFLAVCFTVMALSYIRTISLLPTQITLIEGEEYVYNFSSPFALGFKTDKEGMLELSNKGGLNLVSFDKKVALKPSKKGSLSLSLKAFGFIPLKTMKVDIVPNIKIAACGNTVGVKLFLKGIMIIGLSDVSDTTGKSVLPAKESGIKPGDIIEEVNGEKAEGTDWLVNIIEGSGGKTLKLSIRRGDSTYTTEITPILSSEENKYRLGMWVRDSTAGIGTLTFFDRKSGKFGALGHGITDVDTGALMPIQSGEILDCSVVGIKKGRSGTPGELKGLFLEDELTIGRIFANSEGGIYGALDVRYNERLTSREYPIALRAQIKEGPAKILSNIDGKEVKEYDIEIQKVSRQNLSGSKGMIIKITDLKLLEQTGGIVQGMSGSPIVQDGKMIGAVTHVLVNDPTRGYGIFIETMLKSLYMSEEIEKAG